MLPYMTEKFGNPSNLYELGRQAKEAVIAANGKVADFLRCRTNEVFFTGSATEADNLAIVGTARANKVRGNKIIISALEHKGIIAACEALQKEGFEIIKIPVGKNALVDLKEFKKALDEKTILVSVTMADSETGTIQPIKEIGRIIKKFKNERSKIRNDEKTPVFHADASQAAAHLEINVDSLGVDLMTISAHKLGGPKGIGALFVRRGTLVDPIIHGGGQSRLRSGTENVPAIVGFAKALELNAKEKKRENARLKKLRDKLEKGIFAKIPKVILNGHQTERLANFLNVSILDVEGEAMLLYLDESGIAVGTGSACNSESLSPSTVLEALGNPYEFIHGSLRFTFGRENGSVDVAVVLKCLPEIVKKLRAVSPLELSMNQKEIISDQKVFVGNNTPHFLRKKKNKDEKKS